MGRYAAGGTAQLLVALRAEGRQLELLPVPFKTMIKDETNGNYPLPNKSDYVPDVPDQKSYDRRPLFQSSRAVAVFKAEFS